MRIERIFLGMSMWIATATGTGCLEEAAGKYSLNPSVLYAIVKTESRLNPYAIEVIASAVDKNIPCPFRHSRGKVIYSCMPGSREEALKLMRYARERGYSYSAGLGQINSWWIRRLGLKPESLLEPCYNLHVSAYILNLCWRRFGDSWKTIDCYNKGAGRATEVSGYTVKIYGELSGWMVRGK